MDVNKMMVWVLVSCITAWMPPAFAQEIASPLPESVQQGANQKQNDQRSPDQPTSERALDLLLLEMGKYTLSLPHYNPFLHDMGIKFHWFDCISQCWSKGARSDYAGGIDAQLFKYIHVAMNMGYMRHACKKVEYENHARYQSKGGYLIAQVGYTSQINPLSHVVLAIGYGYSRLTLSNCTAGSKHQPSYAAQFIQLYISSEARLLKGWPIYVGCGVSMSHLLACPTSQDQTIVAYMIPGYGRSKNKITFTLAPYLKWRIRFVETQMRP